MKDLEKEKDALCSGLEVLEETRLWYLQRLQENSAKKDVVKADCAFGSVFDATPEVQKSGGSPESSRKLNMFYIKYRSRYTNSCSNPPPVGCFENLSLKCFT